VKTLELWKNQDPTVFNCRHTTSWAWVRRMYWMEDLAMQVCKVNRALLKHQQYSVILFSG